MRQSFTLFATMSLLAAGAVAACHRASDETSCFEPFAPGVVVYSPSIDLEIRDASGRGLALGTKVVVHNGADSITTTGTDTLHIRAGYMNSGVFTVRVSRPFYRDTVIQNVIVRNDKCTFVLAHLSVTLQLAPGAPPIRSLAVFGTDFLYAPGVQRQLDARLDANPGVPSTVTWQLSDTVLARIDATGLVTAKCTLAGGVDTVTVTALADTTFKARALFGVAKQATCS